MVIQGQIYLDIGIFVLKKISVLQKFCTKKISSALEYFPIEKALTV